MEDERFVPDGARRRCVVPELDGEMFAQSEPLDELMLSLAEWADDEPDEVPAGLHRAGSDAVGDVRMALNGASYRALYAPDGRYEHEPLAVIELPAATISAVGVAAAQLGRAVHGRTEVGRAVRELAAGWHPRGEVTAERLVEVAARLHGVFDLGWGIDEQRIARRLEEGPAGGDVDVRIVLDAAEEAAYGRIRDRLVRMWHDFDPLSQWMY